MYAEFENIKAINVYEKLGLNKLNQEFIEKDFYFDKLASVDLLLNNNYSFVYLSDFHD